MDASKPLPGKHDPKDALGSHDTGAHAAVEVDPDVQVTVHSLRCPYCHDGCTPAESVACRDCLARHHTACWDERGRCASCSSTYKLVAEAPPERSRDELVELLRAGKSEAARAYFESRGATADEAYRQTAELAFAVLAEGAAPAERSLVPSGIFALQTVALLVSGAAALSVAEVGVYGGLASMIVVFFLHLWARVRLGKAASGAWLWQLGLLGGAAPLAVALIQDNDIGPSASAPELAALGCLLALLSLVCAVALVIGRRSAR